MAAINILPLRRAILANLPDGSYIGSAAYWAKWYSQFRQAVQKG